MNINSLADNLKDIPQAKLVQYVQDPNSVVPQFLALAEIQRRKSLERGAGIGAPQTTVAQDIMAQANPVQPQQPQGGIAGLPPQQAPQGVPSLPSGMNQQSFAGGGIVAFAGDKKSDVEDPYANNEYMQRVRRNQEVVSEGLDFGELLKLKNWDPVQSSYRAVKQGVMDPWERFMRESKEEQAIKFNAASEARKGERPTFVDRPEDIARDKEAKQKALISKIEDESKRGIVTPAQATYSANAPQIDALANSPTAAERAAFYEKKPSPVGTRTTSKKAESAEAAPVAPKEDMYSRYEEMLKGQAAEAKAGREQDKWMRLVEAGLGMMGGTSPYAAVNIGQGSMGAMKGYAQDVAAGRKEDRDNIKELMGLGMKREEAQREAEKLAMTKELYGAHGQYYKAAAAAQGARAAGVGAGAGAKLTIAQEKNAVTLFNTWLRSNPMASPEEQNAAWLQAQQRAGTAENSGNIAPTVAPIQWNTLGAPKKP